MDWPTKETIAIWCTNSVMAAFLLVTIIGICRVIRRQFKARVNCWFCNKNTWVPFELRNQWTCPSCEQYNGFKDDGDYNKDLRAQYSPKYNKAPVPRILQTHNAPSPSPSSGGQILCDACCRNQELKVQRLASFEPKNEDHFDEEVEQYKEQLEELYRLCPNCERLVKRRLNQAKTHLLGMKRRNTRLSNEVNRGKVKSSLRRIRLLLRQLLLFVVICLLIQYFVDLRAIQEAFSPDTFSSLFTSSSGLGSMGYRLALGLTVAVLLGKGKPMNGNEYLSVASLSSLHFLVGENLIEGTTVYEAIVDYLVPIEWFLRVVAVLSSMAMFVEPLRAPTSVKLNNDSFHRIEVDDDDEDDRTSLDDSRSTGYYYPTSRLDTSTDFGSVFEYPQSVTSNRPFSVPDEDEEIRNISLNSMQQQNRSFLNRSDPLQSNPPQQQNAWASASPSKSTMNLHSPSKVLFPDDRFSNSIKSMRIGGGEYHQINQPGSMRPMQSPCVSNPFMRNMPLSVSNRNLSQSSATLCGSQRSLLTPSRLSLVSGASAFTDARSGSSWVNTASGFWTSQYPNVFTAKASSGFSHALPAKSMGAHSLDHGLNERFVPLTESRSSSESSGFESRQSTSSCQIPAFSPIGSASPAPPSEATFKELKAEVRPSIRPRSESGSMIHDWGWNGGDTLKMGSFLEPDVLPRF